MPIVFIHGVPDTYRVWDRVRRQLSRNDILGLALPGFDSPVPDDFTATKEDYVDWIIKQIEKQPGPVDLVGQSGILRNFLYISLRGALTILETFVLARTSRSEHFLCWIRLANLHQNLGF